MAAALLFYKDGFGIKYTTKVDMPLNKESKPNQILFRYIESHILI